MRPRPALLPLLAALALAAVGGPSRCDVHWETVVDTSGYTVVSLTAGPDLEFQLRGALLTALPGTVIELPAGRFAFRNGISWDTSHIVIRGRGMYRSILDFTGQERGAQGLLTRGDHNAFVDFSILNPDGDGIKAEFVDGVVFERVRVEWTNGPDPGNGDYGLYPAQSSNVLISQCIVRGARDAGIYVGQSVDVVVRWSVAEWNVLGIEIENSQRADVYGNATAHNTGGMAIFNLPNLQVDGTHVRVFDNVVIDNNTGNFAAGGILARVPPGSGILVVGHDQVELFGNQVRRNGTANVGIADFQIAFEAITDPDYDPYAEGVHLYGNQIAEGGAAPDGILGLILFQTFQMANAPIPDIVLGGWVDPDKIPGGIDPAIFPPTLQVLPENKVCIHDNPGATFGSVNAFQNPRPLFDLAPHDCTHAPLADAELDPTPPFPIVVPEYTPEEIEAICNAPGVGVNWAAFAVDCPELSDYRLFPGGDPRVDPSPGGVPFDLTMPLFSDYARKHRFVFLPPGTAMQYSESNVFGFPLGTIIAKTFSFVDETTGAEEIVETRLLVRREFGWEGIPYIWNDEETEAYLSLGGGLRHVVFTDPSGVLRETDYSIPSRIDCGDCHMGGNGKDPIGPKARLLNRDLDFGAGLENQIDHFAALGILAGAPPSAGIFALPGLDGWDLPSADLNLVARAYLESNCAHCHSTTGRAGFTGFHLEYDQDPFDTSYGICKRPVAAGSGSGGLLWDIVPGNPDLSILALRVASTDSVTKMPEIEKSVAHDEALEMLRAWISQLPPGSCS